MARGKVDILLAGVGGQGTILASDILAEVGLQHGYDVKKAEVHGMSQRGGAVESHVRWGERVYSPQVEAGQVDYLLGLEMLEAARWTNYLAVGGVAMVNRHRVAPPSVNLGTAVYPSEEEIQQRLARRASRIWWVDGTTVARQLGNQTLAGVVLLGAFSGLLGDPEDFWLPVIERLVPAKFAESNRAAFSAGRKLWMEGVSQCATCVS